MIFLAQKLRVEHHIILEMFRREEYLLFYFLNRQLAYSFEFDVDWRMIYHRSTSRPDTGVTVKEGIFTAVATHQIPRIQLTEKSISVEN